MEECNGIVDNAQCGLVWNVFFFNIIIITNFRSLCVASHFHLEAASRFSSMLDAERRRGSLSYSR